MSEGKKKEAHVQDLCTKPEISALSSAGRTDSEHELKFEISGQPSASLLT